MRGSRALTDLEITQILEALEFSTFALRNKALFLVGLKTGFRISELLSLRLTDVFRNGFVVDRIEVKKRFMKKKKEGRIVALHPHAKEALGLWVTEISQSPPETYLFKSREGSNRPMTRISAWRMLRNAYDACHLTGKLGCHAMRKTFAKKVHEKLGKDLVRTQKALGHASVNSTVSYLSFADEEIDDAILKS